MIEVSLREGDPEGIFLRVCERREVGQGGPGAQCSSFK